VESIKGFVTICPLGLFGFNGCGYAAVDGGYGIVSADHIKPIPKLKHIFENRYNSFFPVLLNENLSSCS
jgi:hypothetical protein